MSDLISRSDLLKKFTDAGVQITFDLPVEEVLGDEVDIDDFTMLVQDAIQAYRKMVLATIQEQPTINVVEDKAAEAYNKGLQDVWELVKELYTSVANGGISTAMSKTIFGCDYAAVIHRYTPQEALAKFEPYRKEQAEIKVGDVIESGNTKGIALQVYEFSGYTKVNILLQGGEIEMADYTYNWKKTGKHIDIASILAEIGKE